MVSCNFFVVAIEYLDKRYGTRMCDQARTNEIIKRLGEVEQLYKELPQAPKKKRRGGAVGSSPGS